MMRQESEGGQVLVSGVTSARVLFGLALVAQVKGWARVLLHIVRRGPQRAVRAPVPGVGASLPTPILRHAIPPHVEYGTREICKLCWQINVVGFHVPDDVWTAVVPPEVRERIVCLPCFARLADEKLVPWDRDIALFPVSLATHLQTRAAG